MKKIAVLIIFVGAIAAGIIGYKAENRAPGAPVRMLGVDMLAPTDTRTLAAKTPNALPLELQQQAQAQQAQAAAQLAQAQQAQAEADQAARLATAQWDATRAALDAEAAQLDLEMTREAAAASATRREARMEAEILSTAQAQIRQRNEYNAKHKRQLAADKRSEVFSWFIVIAGSLFLLALAVVAILGLHRILDAVSLGKLVKVMPNGDAIALLDADGDVRPYKIDMADLDHLTSTGRIRMTRNGKEVEPLKMTRDTNPANTNRILVRQTAEKAAAWEESHPEHAGRFPGHRELEMSSSEWQRVRAVLTRNHVIKTVPGKGTFYEQAWDAYAILTDFASLHFEEV